MEGKYYISIDPDTGVFYFTQEETNAYMDYTTMERFCVDNRKRNLKINPNKYNPETKIVITINNYADYIIAYDILAEPSKIEILEDDLLKQQLAMAETIEKQEIDKLELQLALAEFIESTTEGGV